MSRYGVGGSGVTPSSIVPAPSPPAGEPSLPPSLSVLTTLVRAISEGRSGKWPGGQVKVNDTPGQVSVSQLVAVAPFKLHDQACNSNLV